MVLWSEQVYVLNLRLSGNIFECNCMSIQFIQWTQETHISLDNKGNYSCVYIDGSTKSTVYAKTSNDYYYEQPRKNEWENQPKVRDIVRFEHVYMLISIHGTFCTAINIYTRVIPLRKGTMYYVSITETFFLEIL
jgi:hypothetical protein